jgi:hypothetical protein
MRQYSSGNIVLALVAAAAAAAAEPRIDVTLTSPMRRAVAAAAADRCSLLRYLNSMEYIVGSSLGAECLHSFASVASVRVSRSCDLERFE